MNLHKHDPAMKHDGPAPHAGAPGRIQRELLP